MSVLALVTRLQDVELVVRWAAQFAKARETNLTVLCWADSPSRMYPLLSDEVSSPVGDELVESVQNLIHSSDGSGSTDGTGSSAPLALPADRILVRRELSPNSTTAALVRAQAEESELIVAAAEDPAGQRGATYATNPLLRQSSCNTMILFGEQGRSTNGSDILVANRDNSNDVASLWIASRMSKTCGSRVVVARMEEGDVEQAVEVGRRELRQLLRDAGVKKTDRIKQRVFQLGDIERVVDFSNKMDLVLLGANDATPVKRFLELTERPTVAVIKRAPPLRPWDRKRRHANWIPKLSPADYADLYQNLRRGSQLSVDFLTMLGLASGIASLGLLQDSAAVVIGSMLLAPLMTPMIASGLALAQANPKLGRNSLITILYGLLLTLAIGFLVGIVTPGQELTMQVIARGTPNLLDMAIAILSAAAAAYAMARPSLVGAVAGVAIATAIVPPLCSVGISLAYQDYLTAKGAALLFSTNVVAIVLGAALTFRMLGITSVESEGLPRRWVHRTVIVLGIVMCVLVIPLGRALEENIELGKPRPSMYPLTKALEDRLARHARETPEIEIVATGRPSSEHARFDVVIVLASPRPLKKSYEQKIIAIVHQALGDDSLNVKVHCLQEAWIEDEPTPSE